jgi:serine phosphatase RsbU (regulator of sigma subunit)
VNEDADAATEQPGIRMTPEAKLVLGTSPDLGDIARNVLDATVPAFATAAGVFVLEQVLRGGEAVRRGTDGMIVLRRLSTGFAAAGRAAPERAFPPGQVIAFHGGSPIAHCVETGAPVVFGQPIAQMLDYLAGDGQDVLSRYTSFLAVPMRADAEDIGLLLFGRTAQFYDDDVAQALRLAARAATAISTALILTRQRFISDALQRGLLAAQPAAPSRLEIAARCLPAAGQLVGGDWYDIIPLPGERTGLIVGDVMGHGPEAAAVMAQLRAAAHALADVDLPPARLLRQLNRSAATLQHLTLATCAYAVIDPATRSCTMAGAGHLPPVLSFPDGSTRVPELPAGQSLGLGPADYGQASIELAPGAIVALYTDGLVETRTRSFDQGIIALRGILASGHQRLEPLCDLLIASLAVPHEDDVTVVLARVPAGGDAAQSSRTTMSSAVGPSG